MYSKTAVKANRVDKYRVSIIYLYKIHGSVILVEYWYFIGVSSHSYIGHCFRVLSAGVLRTLWVAG